jgi:hypothetical protein
MQGTDTQQQAVDMWDQLVQLVTSGQEFVSPFSTKRLALLEKVGKRQWADEHPPNNSEH